MPPTFVIDDAAVWWYFCQGFARILFAILLSPSLFPQTPGGPDGRTDRCIVSPHCLSVPRTYYSCPSSRTIRHMDLTRQRRCGVALAYLIRFTTGQVGEDIGYGCSVDSRRGAGGDCQYIRLIRTQHKRMPPPATTTTTSKTAQRCTKRRYLCQVYRGITIAL